MCVNRKVTGIDFNGGYAEYMIAPMTALAAIPDELPAEEAGPFMCAGVTVYNALRNSGARAGEAHGVLDAPCTMSGSGCEAGLAVQYLVEQAWAGSSGDQVKPVLARSRMLRSWGRRIANHAALSPPQFKEEES